MQKAIPAALVAGLMLVGCARTARVESAGEVDVSSTPVDARTLPGGTSLDVTLDNGETGDSVTFTVEVVAKDTQY